MIAAGLWVYQYIFTLNPHFHANDNLDYFLFCSLVGEDVCLILCEPTLVEVVELLGSLAALCKQDAPADLAALAFSSLLSSEPSTSPPSPPPPPPISSPSPPPPPPVPRIRLKVGKRKLAKVRPKADDLLLEPVFACKTDGDNGTAALDSSPKAEALDEVHRNGDGDSMAEVSAALPTLQSCTGTSVQVIRSDK